jgi:hypothetical protein
VRKYPSVINKYVIALIVISACSCGMSDRPEFDSLMDGLPRVVSIYPEDNGSMGADEGIDVLFSVPLEPVTVTEETFVVVAMDGDEQGRNELVEEVEDGDLLGLDGEMSIIDNGTRVLFQPASPLVAGKSYIVIVTSQVMSSELLPLTQHPGMAGSSFVSSFKADGSGAALGGETADPSEGDGIVRNRPQKLVINEVLYDVAGSDTDGDVFIELYGDAGGDVTDYKINLINGDDGVIKDTIKIPANMIIPDDGILLIADSKTGQSGVSNVSDADLIDNHDPQNGPDCIQLVDHSDNLLDSIGYGEGIVALAENGLPCFEGMPTPKVSSGQSLSRFDALDTDDNLTDFIVLDVTTPGDL